MDSGNTQQVFLDVSSECERIAFIPDEILHRIHPLVQDLKCPIDSFMTGISLTAYRN
jgi:hypothetical protein